MKGDFIMAYRYGNREQIELFPPSIEDYISRDHPVRAYDAFVEALNLNELGIILNDHKVGNSEYYPKAMLKLLIYGYSYGFRSSRKLERAVNDNFSFVWLTGGMRPDHKTIAEFRRRNKAALKNILKQCARLCIALGLIDGNTLFTDGTKIRANAAIKNTWTEEKCKHYLQDIDRHIESILSECETMDDKEQDQESSIKMKASLKEKKILKAEVEKILKELRDQDKQTINTIDPECVRINSIQGSHAGYNAQIVVDEKHGLIVNTDVVSKNNDVDEFANQINQANETLRQKCKVACADTGYADTSELEKIDSQGIKVIVPSRRQACRNMPGPFDKEHFKYDAVLDRYICPEGNELRYIRTDKGKSNRQYIVTKSSLCKRCRHFGVCTKASHGRLVTRLLKEDTRKRLEVIYAQPESQAIYKLRKQKVELPFGHIKRNLKVDAFLLRGRDGAKLEMSLLASCFNIARTITIFGVKGFIQELWEEIFCLYRKIWFKRQKIEELPSFMSKNICLN